MNAFSFRPPEGLAPAQQQAWEQRRQVAEAVVGQYPPAGPAADDLLHLQRYVAGYLTLAQVIARLLDAQARR